ncbi:hypothetical protein MMC13_000347 [Lambiella insularis]|nr:hypothetical protein [Lambiella insularis]
MSSDRRLLQPTRPSITSLFFHHAHSFDMSSSATKPDPNAANATRGACRAHLEMESLQSFSSMPQGEAAVLNDRHWDCSSLGTSGTHVVPPSSAHQSGGSISSHDATPSTGTSASDECVFSISERNDLRLMHHFTLTVYKTIGTSPEATAVWHDLIPQLAFEHDFLLHGILALASLHLALTSPSSREASSATALRHYTAAIGLFRPHLNSITSSNISPIFAFSTLVPLYIFGYTHTFALPLNPLPEIFEIIAVLRGCAGIVRSGAEWLENGPFKHLLLPEPTDPLQALPIEIEVALSTLSIYNGKTTADTMLLNSYSEAIGVLRESFKLALNAPGEQKVALPFPILISPEVPMRMREGDPIALVILAHYGVILHWLGTSIWMKGWGAQTVDAVKNAVGEDWQKCITWAVEEVRKPIQEHL